MPQLLVPDQDIVTTNWTKSGGASAYYDAVDDGIADETYQIDTGTTGSAIELGFQDAFNIKSPHFYATGVMKGSDRIRLNVRAKYQLGSGSMTFALFEGATQRATRTVTLSVTSTTYSDILTSTESNAISDYKNLRVKITNVSAAILVVYGVTLQIDYPTTTIMPISDVTKNNWTNDTGGTTDIYQAIDQDSVSTTNYIKNTTVATSGGEYYEGQLRNYRDPRGIGNDPEPVYWVFYLWRNNTSDITFDVYLRQGASTTIRSQTGLAPKTASTWTTYVSELTSTQINNITDWNDLRIRIYYNQTTLNFGREGRCAYAGLYVPHHRNLNVS